MDFQWLRWAKRLQAIAQDSLTYTRELAVLAFGYWFFVFQALDVPAGTLELLVAYGIATAAGHLNVNLTLVSVQQNDQTKKISAWAAILIVPTIITGIYGMNFRYMPELDWLLGYPLTLVLMVAISVLFYIWFRRSDWL